MLEYTIVYETLSQFLRAYESSLVQGVIEISQLAGLHTNEVRLTFFLPPDQSRISVLAEVSARSDNGVVIQLPDEQTPEMKQLLHHVSICRSLLDRQADPTRQTTPHMTLAQRAGQARPVSSAALREMVRALPAEKRKDTDVHCQIHASHDKRSCIDPASFEAHFPVYRSEDPTGEIAPGLQVGGELSPFLLPETPIPSNTERIVSEELLRMRRKQIAASIRLKQVSSPGAFQKRDKSH